VLIPVILLVVGACLFSVYQRLSPPNFDHIQATNTIEDSPAESDLNSGDIVAMNLFGTTQTTAVQVEQSHQDIPETNLRLALKGAFAHSVPKKASALIAPDLNSKAELFFIDDSLPGGAVLDKVYPDYVIIRRNGQLEKLQFQRSQLSQTANSNLFYNSSESRVLDHSSYKPLTPAQSSYKQSKQAQSQSPQYSTGPTGSSNNSSSTPSSLADIRERLRTQGSSKPAAAPAPAKPPYVEPAQDQNSSLQYETGATGGSNISPPKPPSLTEIRERLKQQSQQ